MWRRILFVWLAVAVSAFAQEGHPLTGTWTGDWGPANSPRTHLTLVINWDSDDKIAGVLNPGPDSTPITIAVNLTNWTVRIDADAKDASGYIVHIQADGKLEDMGSPRRRLTGTWHQGSATGDFKVTREQ
jgi:hypothetical protein